MLLVTGKMALTRSQRRDRELIRQLPMPRRHLDRSSTSVKPCFFFFFHYIMTNQKLQVFRSTGDTVFIAGFE